ncbi:MAG TPA: EAL domain-containing protein, partial [Usitatibacter sp.]|nr:EAL domain-containing protein [Usitatibacter sp.]
MRRAARWLGAIGLALACCAHAQPAPERLVVVTDENYPPYLFRGPGGELRGMLKDKWELWSRYTGVAVVLEGTDWSLAQNRVREGDADVIDALSYTEARAREYEFGSARGQIEARLFFDRTLGGIHDVASLRGIAVGAKAGSACGEWLKAHGVQLLRLYTDSRTLVEAATGGDIRLFCMDTPTARYLLVEAGLHDQFNESAPLYTTTHDWAVRQGRADLRDFIQRGFARIPKPELEAIEERWLGNPLRSPIAQRYVAAGVVILLVGLVAALALFLRSRFLHRSAAQLSRFDSVTGLPNRGALLDHLRPALGEAAARKATLGLIAVSVDRVDSARGAYGQPFADGVLQEAGGRIGAEVPGTYLASLGSDDFAVVLPGLERPEDAAPIARRILATLQRPYDFEAARVYCGAAAGIAIHPGDGGNPGALLQSAAIALAHARQARGEHLKFFRPEMQAHATRRLQLETALRGALERGEFLLHYQPRFEAAGGILVGFEALLRWRHPDRGVLAPAEFIDVLEETGGINAVGEWVFRSACEQVVAWEKAGLQPLPVAVNLSATQFRHRGLDVAIARIIAETGVNAGLIEIELTESSLMHDPEEAVRTLRHLESYGLKLSVDDFGTGYSSLAYLKRFPLDALKIDRTFVRDATTNADDAAITKAIIQLAHNLGLRVVAEGV